MDNLKPGVVTELKMWESTGMTRQEAVTEMSYWLRIEGQLKANKERLKQIRGCR